MSKLFFQRLPDSLDAQACFRSLSHLPHVLWLDSASDHDAERGRYSFLMADPVAWCDARVTSPNPWPVLHAWCRQLEAIAWDEDTQPELPPFRGGIAGLIAYEAAWWLEPSLRCDSTPFPDTPAMAIGLYDWTLAIDHQDNSSYLISTGLDETFLPCPQRASSRAAQVLPLLARSNATTLSNVTPDTLSEANNGCEVVSSKALPFATRVAGVSSNFSEANYQAAVEEIIQRISAGDSFQVNLSQQLSHPASSSPQRLFEELRTTNPAPYAAFLDVGDYQVISSSPEGFLKVRQGKVITRPIKGTVSRTGDVIADELLAKQLLASEKDRAENIMIVDLMRNDLSRVCLDESVQVTGLCKVEQYQAVQHLVSTVEGVLRQECTVADLLTACFPGGSITGAPKVEAMRTIAQLERVARGPYCGSIGYVSTSGHADFNILIRTITQQNGCWTFPVGGGITAQSDAKCELEETWVKASGLLRAILSEENKASSG